MKKTVLAALLAAISATTLASNYYIVVPVPNRTPTTGNILVTLNPTALPGAIAGRAYAGFDFGAVLQVAGDPNFTPAGVVWSVAGGPLPAGLVLSRDGKLTGTPTVAGTSSFQVQAAYKTKSGQQAYRVVVGEVTVALSAADLPTGVQGAAYFYDVKPQLAVSGDPAFSQAGVTWNFVGEQPPGLQLNTNGTITGIPTTEGTHPITVKASYLGKSGQQTYQILVGAIEVSLSATTAPAPRAVYGQAYNAGAGWNLKPNLSVSGDAAYEASTASAWSVVGGALPAGLSLSANGIVTGTPGSAGTSPIQVRAEYKGKSATQSYPIPYTAGVAQQPGYRTWSDGTLAASCNEYRAGKTGYAYSGATGDGVYRIDVDGAGSLTSADVVCDMTTDGGGWTVFQRRVNGTLDFYRTYAEYAKGFGDTVEYWLGNDRLAAMTAGGAKVLRVDMARTDGQTAYALYSGFNVSSAADSYRLSVTWAGGPAGDAMTYHSGQRFSAKDVDNDSTDAQSCAARYKGGWWYNACHYANLNGEYIIGAKSTDAQGVEWYQWTGHFVESLARTEMKVR